jgi:hypothetical protein
MDGYYRVIPILVISNNHSFPPIIWQTHKQFEFQKKLRNNDNILHGYKNHSLVNVTRYGSLKLCWYFQFHQHYRFQYHRFCSCVTLFNRGEIKKIRTRCSKYGYRLFIWESSPLNTG